MAAAENSWLSVCGAPAPEVCQTAVLRHNARIAAGDFDATDVAYVASLWRPLISGELDTSNVRLEKLRRLCQLWDLDLKTREITSHRKIIGPFIVGFKKLLQPMLRVLLKETLQQQRDFNAAAIGLLADVVNEKKAQ